MQESASHSYGKKIEMAKVAEQQIIGEHNSQQRLFHQNQSLSTNPDVTITKYIDVTNVDNCCIESFAKPNGPNLKEFIYICEFNTLHIPRNVNWKWPLKMKVANAMNGERCIVLLAYQLHTKPISPLFQS
eukprot:11829540-Ditylum_brightwellii.AAC.1